MVSITSANVALPTIQHALGASGSSLSLVLTVYALGFGLVLVPAGRLGDVIGHHWVFISGALIFAATSLWCGLATDITQLIIARAVAGVGAGLAITPITALIQLWFAGPERAKPFAVMGTVFAVSVALGPLVGGSLIAAAGEDIGWRLTLAAGAPIGLLAAILAIFLLPRPGNSAHGGFDGLGVVLLIAGLGLIMVPLSIARDAVGLVIVCAAAGIVFIGLLLWWSASREARGRSGLVPPSLFRSASFDTGLLASFFGFASFTGAFLVLSLVWMRGQGASPLEAGLMLLPYSLGSVLGALGNGRLWAKLGRHTATLGLSLLVVGLAAVALILLLVPQPAITLWLLAAPLVITGMGTGLFVGPNTNATVASVTPKRAGVASGLIGTAQRFGTAVAIPVLTGIMAASGEPGQSLPTAGVALLVAAGFALAGIIVVAVDRSPRFAAPGRKP